ncbi:hypothetical protein vnz_28295 [Streptomyces venezuelae]|nr:hypothetical protein vnz_28295 [Streptomyces venezuelae]
MDDAVPTAAGQTLPLAFEFTKMTQEPGAIFFGYGTGGNEPFLDPDKRVEPTDREGRNREAMELGQKASEVCLGAGLVWRE